MSVSGSCQLHHTAARKFVTMDMFPNAGAGAAAVPPSDVGQMIDLNDQIEKSGCYARNEDSKFPMTNLFLGDSRLGCKSDADEQLIIHLAFKEVVRVRLQIP